MVDDPWIRQIMREMEDAARVAAPPGGSALVKVRDGGRMSTLQVLWSLLNRWLRRCQCGFCFGECQQRPGGNVTIWLPVSHRQRVRVRAWVCQECRAHALQLILSRAVDTARGRRITIHSSPLRPRQERQ